MNELNEIIESLVVAAHETTKVGQYRSGSLERQGIACTATQRLEYTLAAKATEMHPLISPSHQLLMRVNGQMSFALFPRHAECSAAQHRPDHTLTVCR